MRSDCDIIIFGDFNSCLQQNNFSLFKDCSILLRMFCLKQIIEQPARITCTFKLLIDHIYILCNNRQNIVQSGVMPIDISDHF